jgi:antitoxin component YwqK of YwqJK toxin-antitoxin module
MERRVLSASKLLVFCSLLLLFSCKYKAEKLTAYNTDSVKVKIKNGACFVNEAFFTGRLYGLNKKGDTTFIREYKNGLENGISKQFYEDGKLAEIRFYKDGKKTGEHLAYWPNGNKKFAYHFKDDLFEGEQREWYENGKHFQVMHYMGGHENGLQTAWNPDGTLAANYEAKNGRNYGNIGRKNCKSIWEKDSVYAAH